jgi:hypothetical protein
MEVDQADLKRQPVKKGVAAIDELRMMPDKSSNFAAWNRKEQCS